MSTPQTFGDKIIFAIQYKPCSEEYNYSEDSKMAICHLIIGNNFIGNPKEECYLPTWICCLTSQKDHIKDAQNMLFPKAFEGLSDRDIFETILKTNQFEDEFHPDFLHLPQLDNDIWSRHSFRLDETIDGYAIFFYIKDENIQFLIEDFGDCRQSWGRSYKFIYQTVPLEDFYNTIDAITSFLVQHYPHLKDNI